MSPPFMSRENRGRGPIEYDRRYERSPPLSTYRGVGVYHEVKMEKDYPNKVQLDSKGELIGKYADMFRTDIMAFSKELDPGPNWEG
jgi:hypothetical protein